MTSLTKPVRRKTRRSYAVLYVNDARPITVSLEPGDMTATKPNDEVRKLRASAGAKDCYP